MSDLPLSSRASFLKPSPTLAMTARAKAMKAGGLDVLSFAAGEPDFNTPEPICRAAIDALNRGETKYTPSAGTPAMREAVAQKLIRENGIQAVPEEVVVSCGAKHSIANALMAIIDPGDEVILFAPYWMTYADQVRLAGGIPVVVQAGPDQGFVPDLEEIQEAITNRTKAVILNSPSNPTGAAWTKGQIKGLAALALRFGFWVISDEIYERLTYGGFQHESIAALGEDIAQQTITITGCSKTYAMTGWRIGFAHGPIRVAKLMSSIQDQMTSNAASFAQSGAIAALAMSPEAMEAMRAEFEARRDLIVGRLNQMPGVRCPIPQGAFYAFPDISAHLGGEIPDDSVMAEHLLDKAHVACIPGSVFEGPGHLRFSYATDQATITRGMDRLAEALANLAS